MTRRDILSIAMKILGIYFLVKIIQYLPFLVSLVQELRSREEGVFPLLTLVQAGYVLVPLAAAVILLKWSDSIAARLTKDYKYEPSPTARWLGRDELLEVAFIVVGVVIIASALPSIPLIIVDLGPEGILRERAYASTVAVVVQFGIGLYLALGAKGLVSLLSKLRSGAISSQDNTESPKSL